MKEEFVALRSGSICEMTFQVLNLNDKLIARIRLNISRVLEITSHLQGLWHCFRSIFPLRSMEFDTNYWSVVVTNYPFFLLFLGWDALISNTIGLEINNLILPIDVKFYSGQTRTAITIPSATLFHFINWLSTRVSVSISWILPNCLALWSN